MSINLYILVMFAVTYLVRVLPISLIRRKIRSPFLQSFLYYVPYVTLAVMTFPAIIESTQTPVSGILALAAGILGAYACALKTGIGDKVTGEVSPYDLGKGRITFRHKV